MELICNEKLIPEKNVFYLFQKDGSCTCMVGRICVFGIDKHITEYFGSIWNQEK